VCEVTPALPRLASRPLAHWTPPGGLIGVMTDIDDTLTTDGAITPDALAALGRLRDAGLAVIAITGRPVGWSETFAATWPVDALVAENGAVALVPKIRETQKFQEKYPPFGTSYINSSLSKIYQQSAILRAENSLRMQRIAQSVLVAVPGAVLAQDSAGRETDIAIDHSEFALLNAQQIDQVVALLQAAGMTATVSSIHINAWFGDHNKLSGARWAVRELWGRELDAEIDRWVYVGDSANDQVMFEHLPHSIGVANVARFAAQLTHPPRFVTPSERGAGFAEVVDRVLASLRAERVVTPRTATTRTATTRTATTRTATNWAVA
jgi:HAD superfamily hydrolase (TIGR01484 family)